MKHTKIGQLLMVSVLALGAQAEETKPCPPPPLLPGDRIDTPGNFNPLVPGYFADPTIKKFGDIYYLYATTDGNNGGRGPATVWVSRNFVDWYCVPMNWPHTAFYWAPDVIARDGKYYLCYSQPCQIFGGEGTSPIGPWKAMKDGDNVLIPDRFVKEAITLDFQAFEDKDGKTYSYFGTWVIFANSGCGVALVNPDMRTFTKLGLIPNTQAKAFFEAPYMLERDGVYYFMYSSDSCHTETYKVQYATSDKPFGSPFVFGKNNPILQSSEDLTIDGPGHHAMLKEGNEYYMIYHLHDIPRTPNGMHRQLCADKMVFGAEKGVIEQITPTHKGIGMLGSLAKREKNLLFCKPVKASSFYTDVTRKNPYDNAQDNVYNPAYAVDDNNATLWRPASNKMETEWLIVDMEKPETIRRVETQFEYATWYYQYTIEYSTDGKKWKMFADRSANYRWGSPMIDVQEKAVTVRYLRLKILNTEWPGFSGAVWNIKAFADAPKNALAEMADKAFADFILPTYKDGKPGQTAQGFQGAPYVKPVGLLVDLAADAFEVGVSVAEWTNKGKAGGSFKAQLANQPTVEMAAGCKAVRFDGQQWLKATFTAPRSLAGSSSFTAAAWVCNPEFAAVECVLRWGGRGGPEGNMSQLNYGANDRVGAVGHAGFPDMGFGRLKPQAGVWNHIAAVYDGVVEKIYVNGKLANSSPKMLLVTQDQPLFVGASDAGADPLTGFISSVQLYDTPLKAEEIARLAAQKLLPEVACNVNAAKLSAGTIESWTSDGYLGGALKGKDGKPLEVAIINGRMAVRYTGAAIEKDMPEIKNIPACTKISTLNLGTAEKSKWFLRIARTGIAPRLYDSNGAISEEQAKTDAEAKKLLDEPGDADTAWCSELSFFNRKLSDVEIDALYAGWKSRWIRPEPPTFAEAPRAVLSSFVVMRAEQGKSPYGAVEYLIEETTGTAGKQSRGWTKQQDFLCNGLEANKTYAYAIRLRDKYGNVSELSKTVEVSTAIGKISTCAMNFAQDRDFLKDGAQGTQWDGTLADSVRNPEVMAIKDGKLRLQSKNTKWDGDAPNGIFIYKNVQGDFIAIAEVAAYPGWRGNGSILGNNDAGLMVRVPELEDADKGEDFLQLDMFLAWGIGNIWTSFNADHGRPQEGNRTGDKANGFLMIERRGEKFYMRTSPDGKAWADMPRLPIVRADIGKVSTLQVGFAHASYGDQSSWIEFKSLEIITSEKPGKE